MTKKLPTIIFFGNECLATGVATSAPTLRGLIDSGYNVGGLILNHRLARSRKASSPETLSIALTNKIPVLYNPTQEELMHLIKDVQPTAGVLVAYGRIVAPEIINSFPKGIINIHPSLLPKHRGPTPIESVILAGETQTGVSLMKLTSKMDAGPVYAQCTISVPSKISKQALADKLLGLGSELFSRHLHSIIDNKIQPQLQDESSATYDNLIQKKNGQINWQDTAEQIEREVRAYSNWPKSATTLGSYQIIITEADVISATGKPGSFLATKDKLVVYAGQKALSIKRLQPANKKEITVSAFLAGYSL